MANMKLKGSNPQSSTLKILRGFFDEAKKSEEPRRLKWKKNYNYWINQQLSSKRPSYKSDIRVNFCFVITNTKIPVMTANRPTVNFIAYSGTEKDEDQAETMSKVIGSALWHKLKIRRELTNVLWNSSVYDHGIYKIGWDPMAENGIGDLFVKSIEPFKFLKDPAVDDLQKCRYAIHIEPYPISYLKLYHPKYKDLIQADKEISSILYEERRESDRKPRSGMVTDHTKFAVERGYLIEYWLHPAVSGKDLKTGDNKYPKGRVITTINNDVIVEDKPNPYDHGKKPFVDNIMNIVGNEFHGIGDIEQIIPLQDALNHAYQQVDDVATKCANVGWMAHPAIGKPGLERLARDIDKPGALKVAPPELLQSDDAPQLPAYLVRRIEDIVQRIMDVSGITEIMMGSGKVTHRTARGIERLFEAGTSRIGQSIQFSDESLGQTATMGAQTVAQFYTEPRYLPIFDDDGKVAEVMEVNPEDFTSTFEASIDSGAALPRDKQSRADLVFGLHKMGVFEMATSPDPVQKTIARVILDTVEFPGREQLLREQVAPPPPPPEPQLPQGLPVGLPQGAPPIPAPVGAPVGPPAPAAGYPPEVMEMAAAAGLPPDQLMLMMQQAAGIGT